MVDKIVERAGGLINTYYEFEEDTLKEGKTSTTVPAGHSKKEALIARKVKEIEASRQRKTKRSTLGIRFYKDLK